MIKILKDVSKGATKIIAEERGRKNISGGMGDVCARGTLAARGTAAD